VLTLTDAAVAAIRDLLAQTALPAWGGLRISAAAPATGGDEPGFEIAVVASGEARTPWPSARAPTCTWSLRRSQSSTTRSWMRAAERLESALRSNRLLLAAPGGVSGNVSTSFDVLRTSRPATPESSEG
jgi:hypothetical protein